MAVVFISYRRTDASASAGRIYDRFVERFGTNNVYRDIDSTAAGADFVEVIRGALAHASVLVVIIGARWLYETPGGSTRLHDPHDWVRFEISEALRLGITIVPILVEGARMPTEDELPGAVRPFARRQATRLPDDQNWDGALEKLFAGIDDTVDPPRKWARSPARICLSAASFSGVVGLISLLLSTTGVHSSAATSLMFAALVGGLSSAALAVVVVGARRSAWPSGMAIGVPTILGGVFNASLGLVPLGNNIGLVYSLGFGLSALAALLPTHSLQHVVLGATLGAVGGGLLAVLGSIGPVAIVLLVAIIGALVSVAISTAPRPKSRLNRRAPGRAA